jgi:hypothetical protein
MRTNGFNTECRAGSDDGSITQAAGNLDGTRSSGRESDRDVEETPWFNPVEGECKDGFCPMPQRKVEMVHHPDHYNVGNIECIDAIESALSPDQFAGFCRGNAIKYIWRCDSKGGNEDLKKALWYLERLIAKLD